MKSNKLANAVILLVLFVVGSVCFSQCSGSSTSEDNSAYVPPQP